jgi:hypothetical protein
MLRDAAISLSLANLCFMKVWGKMLTGAGAYFNEFPIAYAGILVDVLLLALVFFAGISLARRTGSALLTKAAHWSFVLAILTALNGIALLSLTLSGFTPGVLMGRQFAYFAGIGCTTFALFAAIKWNNSVVRFAPRIILALCPFVLFTFSQTVWKLTRNVGVAHAAEKPITMITVPRQQAATRVLWIIFDEMDQHVSFAARPESIKLPELDRLKSESVYATNAFPPAPLTFMSMPALITGRLISKVTPTRADELMINFDGEKDAMGWSTQPNVFSAARQSGFHTGLVGWCHPYCEVIGGSLTKCEAVNEKGGQEISLQASMFSQAEALISTIPLVQQSAIPLIQRVDFINKIVTRGERLKYIVRYKRVLDGALRASTDDDLDLVMIHSPAPHPPGIYDSEKRDFSLESKNGYLANLELVDRTVGDLRRAMEAAGVWDKTTVIISADHWWRTEMWSRGPFFNREDAAAAGSKMDHRVPFIVRLAGQREPVTYSESFNTVVTHDLILALLRGELSGSESVVAWLDNHRAVADSPYNRDDMLP